MEKETVTLSRKDLQRITIMNQVVAGGITAMQATERLRISLRQVRRLLARYKQGGAAAVAHGNRGRKPAVALGDEIKSRALELAAQPCYAGCNDTHLAELLALRDGISVSRSTLRRWLRSASRPAARKRRPPQYRKSRQRMLRKGSLLQIDASFHPWFEDRGSVLALVAAIDDATGTVVSAHFREQEDTDGYFVMLRDILSRHGIPGALYHDGRSTFVLIRHPPTSLDEQLEGMLPQTQFARAADELGVALIHARSPQAKGRIERLWNTFQDRLVIELRLAGVSTMEAANAFLPGFLNAFNEHFGQPAAEAESGFILLPPNADVDAICCTHFYRKVGPDNTVSVDGLRLQLPPGPQGRSQRGLRVQIQRRLDGTWAIYHSGCRLVHPAVPAASLPKSPVPTPSAPPETTAKQRPKPGPNHPWNQDSRLAAIQKRQAAVGR